MGRGFHLTLSELCFVLFLQYAFPKTRTYEMILYIPGEIRPEGQIWLSNWFLRPPKTSLLYLLYLQNGCMIIIGRFVPWFYDSQKNLHLQENMPTPDVHSRIIQCSYDRSRQNSQSLNFSAITVDSILITFHYCLSYTEVFLMANILCDILNNLIHQKAPSVSDYS